MDNGIKKIIEFNQKIRQLSSDEIVQQYLNFINEISSNKKLPFLLEGNVQWKSDNSEGITRDEIWLKSKLYNPVGKHILENPVTNFLQTHMNHYEIVGTFDISVDSSDLENAKKEILRVLNEITILKNSFSLLYGVSIDWIPARYAQLGVAHVTPPISKPTNDQEKKYRVIRLPKSQESQISSIIDDNHISNIILFAKFQEPFRSKKAKFWHFPK